MSLSDLLQTHSGTVLVVDDEGDVRDLVCRMLWSGGYRTLEARAGAEALHLVELSEQHLALVITDIVMPGIDGRELGRQLAKRWPQLPVLYISGYHTEDIFSRGSPSSSAHFLPKPFTEEQLLATVQAIVAPSTRGAAGG
jgi:two-component system, cell cycle sensor histidine kinase and response regulator CckA